MVSRLTQVSDSTCTSDTVDVLLDVAGQVKVDNVLHVGDVQTSSCYLSTYENIRDVRNHKRNV